VGSTCYPPGRITRLDSLPHPRDRHVLLETSNEERTLGTVELLQKREVEKGQQGTKWGSENSEVLYGRGRSAERRSASKVLPELLERIYRTK